MFRAGILSPHNPVRFRMGSRLALATAALLLIGTIAAGQSRGAMTARMLDLARQMDALKAEGIEVNFGLNATPTGYQIGNFRATKRVDVDPPGTPPVQQAGA